MLGSGEGETLAFNGRKALGLGLGDAQRFRKGSSGVGRRRFFGQEEEALELGGRNLLDWEGELWGWGALGCEGKLWGWEEEVLGLGGEALGLGGRKLLDCGGALQLGGGSARVGRGKL